LLTLALNALAFAASPTESGYDLLTLKNDVQRGWRVPLNSNGAAQLRAMADELDYIAKLQESNPRTYAKLLDLLTDSQAGRLRQLTEGGGLELNAYVTESAPQECDVRWSATPEEMAAACDGDAVCAEDEDGRDESGFQEVCCTHGEITTRTSTTAESFTAPESVVRDPDGKTGGRISGYPYFYIKLPAEDEDGNPVDCSNIDMEDAVAGPRNCRAWCYSECDEADPFALCPTYSCWLAYVRDFETYQCKKQEGETCNPYRRRRDWEHFPYLPTSVNECGFSTQCLDTDGDGAYKCTAED